ncbi:hypothetical protein HOLDEFILI_02942 [Holdemania filiformis DSM 12042]|uniref:Uncharacterized protein n=1 Tax=Holdemania filiformis DSM 12042 TaxID=545696 RepID=B9YAT5_9FIRM|nr:hypothetical protein HOLDEFILI_02942 [Holdemania filiformis DSM 12042]
MFFIRSRHPCKENNSGFYSVLQFGIKLICSPQPRHWIRGLINRNRAILD